jgi:hypothetical protein
MTLLPANATNIERAIETVITAAPEMRDRVHAVPGIKFNPPDGLLPWLVQEYGLAEVAPYIGDLRRVIADGLIWQRRRGTQDALFRALGWIDFSSSTLEEEEPGEHWSEIQIDPGRIPEIDEIPAVQALTGLSIPARSNLTRIYHGYDVRRLVLDRNGFGNFLSDYSGVKINGIVLSFGRGLLLTAQRDATTPTYCRYSNRFLQAIYRDRLILDHSYFGEKPLPNNPMTHSVLRGFVAGSLATPPNLKGRTISRAQVVLSGEDPLGSLNERLSPRILVEIGRTPVLSDSRLSDEIHLLEWQPMDIYPERDHISGIDAISEYPIAHVRTAQHGNGWRRRYWPVLSGGQEALPINRFRTVERGKSAVYAQQPWQDARWPAGKTWNNLNIIIGKNHVRTD